MAFSQYLENQGIQIAQGRVLNTSHIHKFGSVPQMSVNTTGTVWDVNDTTYPWASTFDTGASTLTIDCANAAEVGHDVVIVGLDANYQEIEETVDITTLTGNTTTNSFIRVYRAYYVDGVSITNVGNIDIKYGTTVVARILAGKGQTLMAVYTVPAGKSAYLLTGVASVQSSADATGDMFVRYYGQNNFRVGHTFEVSGSGGQYLYNFPVPIRIPEKSDIDVRARVRSNNARVTSAFDLILIEE